MSQEPSSAADHRFHVVSHNWIKMVGWLHKTSFHVYCIVQEATVGEVLDWETKRGPPTEAVCQHLVRLYIGTPTDGAELIASLT